MEIKKWSLSCITVSYGDVDAQREVTITQKQGSYHIAKNEVGTRLESMGVFTPVGLRALQAAINEMLEPSEAKPTMQDVDDLLMGSPLAEKLSKE